MKNIQIITLLMVVGFMFGCHSQTKQSTETVNNGVDSTEIKQQQLDLAANEKKWDTINATILPDTLRKTIVDYFSNDTARDTITLIVPSGHIAETQSRFFITSSKGEVLYDSEFDTKQLIDGYDFDEEYKANQTIKYYRDRVSYYFGGDDTLPIYSSGMDTTMFVDDDTSRMVWDELKGKPKIKYTYLSLEEESILLIFYSPRLGKAIEVFACC